MLDVGLVTACIIVAWQPSLKVAPVQRLQSPNIVVEQYPVLSTALVRCDDRLGGSGLSPHYRNPLSVEGIPQILATAVGTPVGRVRLLMGLTGTTLWRVRHLRDLTPNSTWRGTVALIHSAEAVSMP